MRLWTLLRGLWREIARDTARPYRPEQHYMRGPGPAWRAKYGPSHKEYGDGFPKAVPDSLPQART